MSFYLSYCSSIFYLSTSASRLGSKGRAACLKTRTARLKCMKGPVCDKLDDGSLQGRVHLCTPVFLDNSLYTLPLFCSGVCYVLGPTSGLISSSASESQGTQTDTRSPTLLTTGPGWHGSSAGWVSPKRCSLQRRFIFRNTT